LSWYYSDSVEISHFNIYHQFNDSTFMEVAQVPFFEYFWTDALENWGLHSFYVTAAMGPIESVPSNIVQCIIQAGDIDFDGTTNVLDIVILLNFILEIENPTDEQWIISDINSDEALNVLDVILIVNLILEN